jgi:DNA modification methylase
MFDIDPIRIRPYWSDGRTTIFHGDCRQIAPLLPTFDLLLTDPPYGINV